MSENEEEEAHNKIQKINNKMLQSAEEKDEIIIEITEDKKESVFEQTNESNRIVKTVKEKPNAADTMQDEIHDQRTVSFSQNCYKRGIEAMSISRKDNGPLNAKGYENKQQKIRDDDKTKPN